MSTSTNSPSMETFRFECDCLQGPVDRLISKKAADDSMTREELQVVFQEMRYKTIAMRVHYDVLELESQGKTTMAELVKASEKTYYDQIKDLKDKLKALENENAELKASGSSRHFAEATYHMESFESLWYPGKGRCKQELDDLGDINRALQDKVADLTSQVNQFRKIPPIETAWAKKVNKSILMKIRTVQENVIKGLEAADRASKTYKDGYIKLQTLNMGLKREIAAMKATSADMKASLSARTDELAEMHRANKALLVAQSENAATSAALTANKREKVQLAKEKNELLKEIGHLWNAKISLTDENGRLRDEKEQADLNFSVATAQIQHLTSNLTKSKAALLKVMNFYRHLQGQRVVSPMGNHISSEVGVAGRPVQQFVQHDTPFPNQRRKSPTPHKSGKNVFAHVQSGNIHSDSAEIDSATTSNSVLGGSFNPVTASSQQATPPTHDNDITLSQAAEMIQDLLDQPTAFNDPGMFDVPIDAPAAANTTSLYVNPNDDEVFAFMQNSLQGPGNVPSRATKRAASMIEEEGGMWQIKRTRT